MLDADEKLMERVVRGDLAALGELFDRHQEALHAFLTRFLGNATWAEDVVQEVFLRVWRYRHTFERSRSFSPWLYGIARRTALTESGRTYRRESSLDDPLPDRLVGTANERSVEGFEDALVEGLVLQDQVRAALRRLPSEQRACVILREYEQRSYEEIGTILECSAENARMLAFRARKALKALLTPEMIEEERCVRIH